MGQPEKNGWESPERLGITSARVEVFCDDPDGFIARAVEAGADGSRDRITDHQAPWGTHRQGGFTDPFGHRHRIRLLARQLEVRILVIDEIHSLLAGAFREQRVVLNAIRFLANDLRIPLVCVGTVHVYIKRVPSLIENSGDQLTAGNHNRAR